MRKHLLASKKVFAAKSFSSVSTSSSAAFKSATPASSMRVSARSLLAASLYSSMASSLLPLFEENQPPDDVAFFSARFNSSSADSPGIVVGNYVTCYALATS